MKNQDDELAEAAAAAQEAAIIEVWIAETTVKVTLLVLFIR